MNTINQGERKTFIVYSKSSHWLFKKLLSNGYEHCYLLIWDGYQWLALDKGYDFMEFTTIELYNNIPLQSHEELLLCLEDDKQITRVQEVNLDKVRAYHKKSRGNFIVSILRANTCVEYVKSYLGMNTLMTVTPYSLMKCLDKIGM